MRAVLPDTNEVGRCEPWGGKRPPCSLCCNMKNTSAFKSKHSNEVYQTNFNCNSKKVAYLIESKVMKWKWMVMPRQNFVLETIILKASIIIFGKNKYWQTKPVTKNAFTNIFCSITIAKFAVGRSQ